MASTARDMKGFYRQRKKTSGGITKKAPSKSKATKKSSPPSVPIHSVTFDSSAAQPSALISHGFLDLQGDYDENEELLRQFDMNMAYGPCVGISRLARWERASSFGLNPPHDVKRLLKLEEARSECLWDGCV